MKALGRFPAKSEDTSLWAVIHYHTCIETSGAGVKRPEHESQIDDSSQSDQAKRPGCLEQPWRQDSFRFVKSGQVMDKDRAPWSVRRTVIKDSGRELKGSISSRSKTNTEMTCFVR